ncbi:hypothetical protein VKX94_02050 [Lactobacillus helveticus]|uniref:Uncharacterized protein n=1 Tax=Lactobacillus helveticus CIRM-BIA 951 TaxID=1226334 RepID=U6F6J3_LACHE|nr:hypothetical protein [Lactobacillus helveticus]MDY0990906.1 hypothetical protein [Lactobacillus helveticus]MDY1001595.1 hypothetical protein [Lactobacillus helveticus]MEB2873427.1 hypothetical protein [Lactobacillus helveticus]CDI58594.1 Predicted protein [Lactobacillus helveticus CIRM-BIA 951]
MLLSFADYQKMGGTLLEPDFEKLESDAEDVINPLINFFYLHKDIDTDMDKERVWLVQKAITLQIDFTSRLGSSTPDEMAKNDVKSVNVDGTSVSTGLSPLSFTQHGVYTVALDYLYQSGLLFRGVRHAETT